MVSANLANSGNVKVVILVTILVVLVLILSQKLTKSTISEIQRLARPALHWTTVINAKMLQNVNIVKMVLVKTLAAYAKHAQLIIVKVVTQIMLNATHAKMDSEKLLILFVTRVQHKTVRLSPHLT